MAMLFFLLLGSILPCLTVLGMDLQQIETTTNLNRTHFTDRPYHKTRNINPSLCQSLSEEECRRLDELEGVQSRRNRLFLSAKGRQKLQEERIQREQQQSRHLQEDDDELTRHPFRRGISSTSGTLNVLVVLLIWNDHVGQRELPPLSSYDELFNSDGVSDFIPSGSIKKWFETSSYGQFSIQATIVDWAPTTESEAFYAVPNRGRTDAIIPAFTPLLQTMEDSGFDFASFDSDGNGEIDLTVFIHSGYDGSQNIVDGFGVPEDQRIAAHARSGCSSDGCWVSRDESFRLGPYVVASGYLGFKNFETARIGIITHEMIHWYGSVRLVR